MGDRMSCKRFNRCSNFIENPAKSSSCPHKKLIPDLNSILKEDSTYFQKLLFKKKPVSIYKYVFSGPQSRQRVVDVSLNYIKAANSNLDWTSSLTLF